MNNYFETIEKMLAQNNGFITAVQITEAGIPRRCLTELTTSKKIYKVDRGIYALPDFWEDDLLFLQYRFSKGIYSHETALYLHSMTDRTPIHYTMTFPKGYNAGRVKARNVKVRYTMLENYELGLSTILSPCKNILKVYDIERTLCDIVKTKHGGDIQVINQAMKNYVVSEEKNIGKFLEYASRLGVKKQITNYMEVLL